MTFFLPLKNIHMWKENSSLLLCSYKQTSFKCQFKKQSFIFQCHFATLHLLCYSSALLTLISMDKKSAHIGTTWVFLTGVLFVQNKMQMCTASHCVATCLFSYIIVIMCEHNVHQFQHLKEKYFQSFLFFILPQNPLNARNIRIYKNPVIAPNCIYF